MLFNSHVFIVSESSPCIAAAFDLVFSSDVCQMPTPHKVHRDCAADILAETGRLMTVTAEDGDFGVFVLDLQSLSLRIENETDSITG
jgi:hypothetical protein